MSAGENRSPTNNDCLAVRSGAGLRCHFQCRPFAMPMCLWQRESNPGPSSPPPPPPPPRRICKVLLGVALQLLPSTLQPTAMNPSFTTPSHKRTQTVGAAFVWFLLFDLRKCFCFFFDNLVQKNPTSAWRETFSVPSFSSRRFLCHHCTTHFPFFFFSWILS